MIKDWDDHFETAESRKLKGTRWVPMPTKHDGKGYRRISQHAQAVEIFCAWNLIVQVASKMPKRGLLADEDGPLDADDLSAKTGFPASIFSVALEFLASDRIGWMATELQGKKPRAARVRQSPPDIPVIRESSSPEGNGREGYGKEQNGTEEKEGSSTAARVRVVFDFWKEAMKHPKAVLDGKRERAITGRLKDGYSTDDLIAAVKGCKATPYNMGDNKEHRVYDDIELICRDSVHVEQFFVRVPSANGHGAVPAESSEQRELREGCQRCFGTRTEVVPGKGARPCNHE